MGDSLCIIWVLPSPVHPRTAPASLLSAYLFPARVQITGKLPFISQYPISATAAEHGRARGNEECAMNGLVGCLAPLACSFISGVATLLPIRKKPNDPRMMRAPGIRDAIDIRSQPRYLAHPHGTFYKRHHWLGLMPSA